MSSQTGLCKALRPHRPSPLDALVYFVRETLEWFPQLTVSRLNAMVRERGYTGRPDHFRHLIDHCRLHLAPKAYLHLRTLPGGQARLTKAIR